MLDHRSGDPIHHVVIDIETHGIALPFNRIDMPVGRILPVREEILVHKGRIAGIVRPVNGGPRPVALADIFENVDFAGIGPFAVAEHPEGRPDTFSGRHSNTCFNPPVCAFEFMLALDPARHEIGNPATGSLEAWSIMGPKLKNASARPVDSPRRQEADRLA